RSRRRVRHPRAQAEALAERRQPQREHRGTAQRLGRPVVAPGEQRAAREAGEDAAGVAEQAVAQELLHVSKEGSNVARPSSEQAPSMASASRWSSAYGTGRNGTRSHARRATAPLALEKNDAGPSSTLPRTTPGSIRANHCASSRRTGTLAPGAGRYGPNASAT